MSERSYALVTTAGELLRRENFTAGQQPQLAPAKGLRWLPDNPPPFDEATQTRALSLVIPKEASEVPYIVMARSLAEVKSERKAALATRRLAAEVAGIVVSGMEIQTDRDSRANMTGATLNAVLNILKTQADPAFVGIVNLLTGLGINGFPLNWKAEGIWATLNPADVIGTANAVLGHVQACFDNEKTISEKIDACATAADVVGIDLEAGWPP